MSSKYPKRKRGFDEEDDDMDFPLPGTAASLAVDAEEDPLWSVYKIHPNLPFRTKVEKLLVGWGMEAPEIAAIIKEDDVDRVQRTITEVEQKWTDLGEGLTTEERKKARGKMIAELQELKQQVESLNETSPDYKHLQLKLNILERMARLQGIEIDKKELPKEDEAVNPVDKAINGLSPERLKDLYERLSSSKPIQPPVTED